MSHTLHTSLEEVILTNLKKSIFQLYEKCKKKQETSEPVPCEKKLAGENYGTPFI